MSYGKYLDEAREIGLHVVENLQNLKDKYSQKFHTSLIENTSGISIFHTALNGAFALTS